MGERMVSSAASLVSPPVSCIHMVLQQLAVLTWLFCLEDVVKHTIKKITSMFIILFFIILVLFPALVVVKSAGMVNGYSFGF